jgi:tetratricopeptide (TPR) repeat protein
MSRNPTRALILVIAALAAITAAYASGGASSPPPRASTEPQRTPEERAREHYNQGLHYRDKAWKLEKQLAGASTDKDRQKLEKKIVKNYGKAVDELEDAVRSDPTMHPAFSSLGYALRKTGRYEESLQAYDYALSLEPSYAEAIEYRAEAYLALDRLEDAKNAYIKLFGQDRARADELLDAMQIWLEHQRNGSANVDQTTLEAFAGWVCERAEIADTTTPVSQLRERDW